MSANKAALLGNTIERKIIEHDRALKGLKVKQYVSSDEFRLKVLDTGKVATSSGVTEFPMRAGDGYMYSYRSYFGSNWPEWATIFPVFDLYLDHDGDDRYLWPHGANVRGALSQNIQVGFKYVIRGASAWAGADVDLDPDIGYMPVGIWIHNQDSTPHTAHLYTSLLHNFPDASWFGSYLWWSN